MKAIVAYWYDDETHNNGASLISITDKDKAESIRQNTEATLRLIKIDIIARKDADVIKHYKEPVYRYFHSVHVVSVGDAVYDWNGRHDRLQFKGVEV